MREYASSRWVPWVLVAVLVVVIVLFALTRPSGAESVTAGNETTPTAVPTIVATPVPAYQGAGFTVSGSPAALTVSLDLDKAYSGEYSLYRNTVGNQTNRWLGEPGVRTADTVPDCNGQDSCWLAAAHQQYLFNPDGEVFPLQEDGWSSFALAGGTFEVASVTIKLDALPSHSWFVVFRALGAGGGDRNLPIKVSGYNAGFSLFTFYPRGARFSEKYFIQNVAAARGGHDNGCGDSGCPRVSAFLFDAETLAWDVITQDSANAAWRQLGSNIAGYTIENGAPLPQ